MDEERQIKILTKMEEAIKKEGTMPHRLFTITAKAAVWFIISTLGLWAVGATWETAVRFAFLPALLWASLGLIKGTVGAAFGAVSLWLIARMQEDARAGRGRLVKDASIAVLRQELMDRGVRPQILDPDNLAH